jgi:hypothetical protein
LVVGFLIGMSLVFNIAGLGKRSHGHHPTQERFWPALATSSGTEDSGFWVRTAVTWSP